MTPLPGTPFAWSQEDGVVTIERAPPPLAAPLYFGLLGAYVIGVGGWLYAVGAAQAHAGGRGEALFVAGGFGLLTFLAVAMAWLRGYPRRLVVHADAVEVHARLGPPKTHATHGATVRLSIDALEDRTAVRVELDLGEGEAPRPLAYTQDGDPAPFRELATALRGVLAS